MHLPFLVCGHSAVTANPTPQDRSPIARVHICLCLAWFLRGTLALSCERFPDALRTAGKMARALEQTGVIYALPMADALAGAIAHTHWARAIARADAAEMADLAAAARLRLGQLLGGAEGAALENAARAWAASEGVSGDRFFDMISV